MRDPLGKSSRPTSPGVSPLLSACREGYVDHVRSLLLSGWDPNQVDPRGRSGLHLAAVRGREDLLKELLEAGADVGAVDHTGNTALHYCGHTETIQCLADFGADLLMRNRHGDTALQLMERKGVEKDATRLLSHLLSDIAAQDETAVPLLNKTSKQRPERKRKLVVLRKIWYDFCMDLGVERLVVVILFVLCLSLYFAYIVTAWSKQIDTRIPVMNEQYHKAVEL